MPDFPAKILPFHQGMVVPKEEQNLPLPRILARIDLEVLNDSIALSFFHSFIHSSMHGHLFSKSIGHLLHAREIVS